jgi:hypothetical protein
MERRSCRLAALIFFATASLLIVSFSTGVAHAGSKMVRLKTTTIMGVLQKEDSSYAIKSGNTKYAIMGQNLRHLVGRKVKASGTMVKGEKGRILDVSRIQEVKGRK